MSNEVAYPEPPEIDYEAEIGQLALPLKLLRDRARFDWSFLNDAYSDAAAWRAEVLPRVMALLPWLDEAPEFAPQWGARENRGRYWRQPVSFATTEAVRAPAILLMPKSASKQSPVPGLVALHCMGGLHTWGKEKIVSGPDDSHPVIVEYRKGGYGGKALADQFAELGYAVLVIDSPLFGERLAIPTGRREELLADRASSTTAEVRAMHDKYGGLVPRALFERHCKMLGTSPAAWIIRDDIRSVDFLASLDAVDAGRLFCTGLSYGGHRTFWLTALCERIRAGAGVGWCSPYGHMFGYNVEATNYFAAIPFLWPHMDFPDLAGLAVPRGLLAMVGAEDDMFPKAGKAAFMDRLRRIYAKAGCPQAFAGEIWPGGHQYTPEMVARTHAFFGEILSLTGG